MSGKMRADASDKMYIFQKYNSMIKNWKSFRQRKEI